MHVLWRDLRQRAVTMAGIIAMVKEPLRAIGLEAVQQILIGHRRRIGLLRSKRD
jgi:hypothetical protein